MIKFLPLVLLISSMNCYADQPLKETTVLIEHIDKMPVFKNPGTKSAMCTASANAVSGFVGQPVTASGYVSYVINNATSTAQNYWVDEYMCINGFGCTHIRNTVSLQAHLSGSGGGSIFNQEIISSKGNYVDQATIQVTGESNCFVQGSNTVYIN